MCPPCTNSNKGEAKALPSKSARKSILLEVIETAAADFMQLTGEGINK